VPDVRLEAFHPINYRFPKHCTIRSAATWAVPSLNTLQFSNAVQQLQRQRRARQVDT